MTETAEIMTLESANSMPAVSGGYQGAFSSDTNFEAAQRMAKALISSTLVPKEYQGANNMGNAIIALEAAQRIGASPLMVMQNLYVVHGKPGWSSQFIIAALNGCGRYEPLEFNMVGVEGTDEWGCYITATTRRTGKELKGPTVTIAMAKAEGWYSKNGSKWQTMPEVMLGYRAASFFGKRYAPDILMGMQTAEELNDIIDVNPQTGRVINDSPDQAVNTINSILKEEATEKVNTETGEVTEGPAADKPAKNTEKDLEERLSAAENPAQVDDVLAMIDDLRSKAAKDRITEKASVRKMDFEG
ncbi:MAG: hypothetical protein RPU15_08820 [Candidatus Sedimenticola sp. (ex Thyasira tokunagai)]